MRRTQELYNWHAAKKENLEDIYAVFSVVPKYSPQKQNLGFSISET